MTISVHHYFENNLLRTKYEERFQKKSKINYQ